MKVVCVDTNWNLPATGCEPKKDEIVTVVGQCPVYPANWDIAEYLRDAFGKLQSFNKSHFIPLDEYLDGISITAEIEECLTREFQEV